MEQVLLEQFNAAAWKQLGVAAIFLILEIWTIIYFYRHILTQQKDAKESAEKLHQALTMSTEVNRSIQNSNDTLRNAMELLIRSQSEFISYLKGRDSMRG
jgi:DNA-directed RNA polymerase specialized sigma54-like protein